MVEKNNSRLFNLIRNIRFYGLTKEINEEIDEVLIRGE